MQGMGYAPLFLPNLVMTSSSPWFFDGPNRNRGFTELKNGWIFHGHVTNNQMVYHLNHRYSHHKSLFFTQLWGMRTGHNWHTNLKAQGSWFRIMFYHKVVPCSRILGYSNQLRISVFFFCRVSGWLAMCSCFRTNITRISGDCNVIQHPLRGVR